MTSREAGHRGTLVCVVLKAKNLPNKRSIGKQDPYCVLQLGKEQQKTSPDKRGGQHPTWDEQLHFEIHDGPEGGAAGGASKELKVTCWADDVRDPEFIGEGSIELADTFKTGEFDEWVTIKSKDRYAGEVYLELTFYSSAAPPKKKKPAELAALAGAGVYGGAGTFTGDHDDRSRVNGRLPLTDRIASNGPGMVPARSYTPQPEMPSALQPSSSLAALNVDEYNPVYAPANFDRVPSPATPQRAVSRGQQRLDAGPSSQEHWAQGGAQHRRTSSASPLPLPPRPSSAQPFVSPASQGMQHPGTHFGPQSPDKPLPMPYEQAGGLAAQAMPPAHVRTYSDAAPAPPYPYQPLMRPASSTYHALPPIPTNTGAAPPAGPAFAGPAQNPQALYHSIASPPPPPHQAFAPPNAPPQPFLASSGSPAPRPLPAPGQAASGAPQSYGPSPSPWPAPAFPEPVQAVMGQPVNTGGHAMTAYQVPPPPPGPAAPAGNWTYGPSVPAAPMQPGPGPYPQYVQAQSYPSLHGQAGVYGHPHPAPLPPMYGQHPAVPLAGSPLYHAPPQ